MPSWGDLEKTLLAPISTRIPSRASPLGRELWGSFVVAGTLFNFVPTDICELLGSLLRYPLVAIENCIYTTVSTDIYHGYRDFFIFDLSLLLPLLCVNVYSASNHSHFIHVLYVTLLSPSHFSKVILITGVPTGMLILLPDRKITGGCERIQFPVFMSRARKKKGLVFMLPCRNPGRSYFPRCPIGQASGSIVGRKRRSFSASLEWKSAIMISVTRSMI